MPVNLATVKFGKVKWTNSLKNKLPNSAQEEIDNLSTPCLLNKFNWQ